MALPLASRLNTVTGKFFLLLFSFLLSLINLFFFFRRGCFYPFRKFKVSFNFFSFFLFSFHSLPCSFTKLFVFLDVYHMSENSSKSLTSLLLLFYFSFKMILTVFFFFFLWVGVLAFLSFFFPLFLFFS